GRHRPPDAVDIGQGNLDPLLRRNVDASNTCHFANSLNAADPGLVRPENHVWTSKIVRTLGAPETLDYRNRKRRVNRHTASRTCSICRVTSSIPTMPSTERRIPLPW